MEEVRTERLVGTRPLPRDADELSAICGLTVPRTRTLLMRDVVHWKHHRFGRWVWREGGAAVAYGGLTAEGEEVAVSVYAAGPDLRDEVARFATTYATDQLGLRLTKSAS